MKKIAGLIVILAALILVGYYGMGIITERTIKKNIQVINQTNGLLANIEEYHRGWFNSTAQIKWRLQVPERTVKDSTGNATTIPAQAYTVNMPLFIHHGPIIIANKKVLFGMGYANTVLPLPAEYNQKFAELFTNESIKPRVDLSIFVNYLAKSQFEISMPKFNLIGKNGNGTLNWLGMEATTTISSNVDKINGDISVKGMSFLKEDVQVNLGAVQGDFTMHQTSNGLYLGDASFKLPLFELLTKNQKTLSINDLAASSNSDIENNLFNTHFKLDLKAMSVEGKTYGPGDIEINLRNLDADVLAQINQQANAMQNSNNLERQQAMLAMLPELPKLFNKGAEFEVSKLNVQLPEGKIEGNLLVALPPQGDNANPFDLIKKVHGNGRLKMPALIVKQLLKQTIMQQMVKSPEMQQELLKQLQAANPSNQPPLTQEQLANVQVEKRLATLSQNGVIVANGSDYIIEIKLDNGKLVINDKPFDSAMMKF